MPTPTAVTMKSSSIHRRVVRILAFVAGLPLITIAGACVADADREQPASGVIARINEHDITVAERNRARVDLRAAQALRGDADDGAQSEESLDRLVLQHLIDRQLMLQEAKRLNLTVSREELDEAVSELRRRFADLGSFGAWMAERGLDDASLFRTVAEDVLVTRVMAALVAGAGVSEEQVRDFYAGQADSLVVGREVRLAIIALSSREEAEAILRALRDGFDFHTLAREHSLGKLAARGGDAGWLDVETLPTFLREVVAELREGEASRPVRKNEHEYLIVALAGSRPVHPETFEEARSTIESRLLRVEQQTQLATWLTRRQRESDIEIIAQGY